ncbi:MAG: DUF4931 domain-containing protein [Clostridiales bacterium]|jgi:UDPglucose--hexose-1-phosphate uridylyltransferase|nr:DUF4931 domain-containing protein [Clostridiales bacterium]
MPEIRRDFLTGTYVTIADERSLRPIFFETRNLPQETDADSCPFCPKNAHMTPSVVYSKNAVRVFPNKYPAFTEDSASGYGFHEVIVDTEEHALRFADFKPVDVYETLLAARSRCTFFSRNPRVKYVQVMKNEGAAAGASIEHSHWQIFALSFLPEMQWKIQSNFADYREKMGKCFLCDRYESGHLFAIAENEKFIAHCPWASAYTHMVDIMPKKHTSDLCAFSDDDLRHLAALIKKCVKALNTLKPGLSYNICLQNAPAGDCDERLKNGHFFVQIIPRVGNVAGFEFSTGCYINSVPPEKAKEELSRLIDNKN